MTKEEHIIRDSYTVLLPAFSDLSLSGSIKNYLSNGGCSILLGETREEYVNRTMSNQRKENESERGIQSVIKEARKIQLNLIVAVDQELVGIQRLNHLVPNFPKTEKLRHIEPEVLESICYEIANKAKGMGVNCFVAPILDIVRGENPWLQGRTWTTNVNEVIGTSTAFIKGVQKSKVIATAKHFPGFSSIECDPAVEKGAIMDAPIKDIEENYLPFKSASECNVEIVMVGPAIIKAIDEINPASTSRKVIKILRDEINYKGIILSDDLDAKATLQNYSIEEVAVKALQAGCNYLLLADIDNQIIRVATEIQTAVRNNEIGYNHLRESAKKIRNLALKYS